MPANAKSLTLRRNLELLAAIPGAGGGITPQGLKHALRAGGHDVNERTIQRDLLTLREQFPALECDSSSKPHRWRWSSTAAKSTVAGMSTPEALALALVQQHLQAALPASMLGSLQPLFDRAAAQLDRLGPRDGQRTWMDKVRVLPSGLPTGPVPDVPLEAQVQVSEALLGNRQLHVDYQRGAGGLVQSYDVAPLGLLLRGGVRYLVGLVGRGQHRFFALHRIRQAEALPKPARIPAGDTLDAVLARSGGQFGVTPDAQPIGLVLLCSPGLAAVLEESPLSSDQKATPEADGRIRLQATLLAGWELRWWLLAHIEEIEICAPPELRRWAHQALVQAAERHR